MFSAQLVTYQCFIMCLCVIQTSERHPKGSFTMVIEKLINMEEFRS